jgi:hypothetical protein
MHLGTFHFPVNTNMAAMRICQARITPVLLNKGSSRYSNNKQVLLDSLLKNKKKQYGTCMK